MRAPDGLTAREVASLTGGELIGPGEGRLIGVAPLDQAGPGDLSFLASGRYLSLFQRTNAGAVLLTPEFREVSGGPATCIVVPDTHRAMARVLPALYPDSATHWGVDPTARVGRGVRWTGRVMLGRGAVVGDGAMLGTDCIVGPGAVIGSACRLGDRCRIESHAVIHSGTVLGHEVIVRAGARVGGPGFGFVSGPRGHERLPQVAGCALGDGVEVGANSTIDGGSIRQTVIGEGTKIDAQVHVGHNVRIGARCLIMAQVGIGGSTDIESDVVLAGQAGLAGHLRVGAGARVGAQSGVIGDIEAGATVSGYPARNHRDVLRQAVALKRLTPLVSTLEQITQPHAIGR
ncbi:MAG: UDP-3-O-(3-hydroxymyristoyl)glucosamine N-acyltransferase [Gemmatimonadetes bacterium]|nr:UDP-3-O-(3-hydroxymyristoyl)glucosamine N-acyltransferase [Gemmatimonadota bacterium]